MAVGGVIKSAFVTLCAHDGISLEEPMPLRARFVQT